MKFSTVFNISLVILSVSLVVKGLGSTSSIGKRNDPASSWLAYAGDEGNTTITFVNMTWQVPDFPPSPGAFSGAPGWWFGIENSARSQLIQPILAWQYEDSGFQIFNGVFYWKGMQWWSSDTVDVEPGQHIVASLTYETDGSYSMYIECVETGKSVTSNIPDYENGVYTDLFVVFEHQTSCDTLPAQNHILFENIYIEREGKPSTPNWSAQPFEPVCEATATVIDEATIMFNWTSTSH